VKNVGPAFDDEDDSTLAAASDVVAKIREQAAELRRGSGAPTRREAAPNPARGVAAPNPTQSETAASAQVAESARYDHVEPVRVWMAGVEGSLINGAAPPPVERTFWDASVGPSSDGGGDGAGVRTARRLPWWLPLLSLMVLIIVISVLVALWLASGSVTS
jgi:hypothetical protein